MLTVIPSLSRGHADLGWLDSRHSFSFGDYHDPARMGFRALRVINDDRVAPGAGFPTHPHHDMEIISIVLSGALEHKDSLGNGAVLRPGEVQVMSAGRGIRHSEFNPSRTEGVHLLQLWIIPDRRGHEPRYDQAVFPVENRRGRLLRVAGGLRGTGVGQGGGVRSDDGALMIHQDADVYVGTLEGGQRLNHALTEGRGAYLFVNAGSLRVNGQNLGAGDAAQAEADTPDTLGLALEAGPGGAEVLLFDLA